jgi:hypothetical protein
MIYKLEETTEQFTIEPNHDLDDMATLIHPATKDADVLRIEEDVYASWSGVSGCCDGDTPSNNVNAAFTKWVKDKIFQYRDLRYLRYGQGGGTARCRTSSSGFPDNRRSCRGSATVKAYIEFEKR